jgi:hypothetical protein
VVEEKTDDSINQQENKLSERETHVEYSNCFDEIHISMHPHKTRTGMKKRLHVKDTSVLNRHLKLP